MVLPIGVRSSGLPFRGRYGPTIGQEQPSGVPVQFEQRLYMERKSKGGEYKRGHCGFPKPSGTQIGAPRRRKSPKKGKMDNGRTRGISIDCGGANRSITGRETSFDIFGLQGQTITLRL
jgi:hypothetical protein